MSSPTPTRIEKHGDHDMLIGWTDGRAFAVSYAELRFHCPCASCVDEMTGMRTVRREDIAADVRPKGVVPVGRYAVRIDWSDGHSTGMYHFDTLHEICRESGRILEDGQ